jgi:sulfite exporter TauE/SafE
MCGPIVLAYTSQYIKGNGNLNRPVLPHLLYNGGRILSITSLGALFGLLGAGIGTVRGVGEWFSIAAGFLLVALGLSLLRVLPFFSLAIEGAIARNANTTLARLYRSLFASLVASRRLESKFFIGFLTPLLPCGLLYSMFVRAASGGSALSGATIMLSFGLGTLPSLMLTGLLSSLASENLRRWGDRVAAATILLMGVMLLLRGFAGGETHTH